MSQLRTIRVIARIARCSTVLAAISLRGQSHLEDLPKQTIQHRLDLYKGDNAQRELTLRQLFAEAGCRQDHLQEQFVPKRQEPNVLCVMPGSTDEVIVVGAHFDHVKVGYGVVDNWSGASLLPSLYEVLKAAPRKHTFWFVGFTSEEVGLLGSKYFVKQLTSVQVQHVEAMINLDTLGLGPTKVWTSQSDPTLLDLLAQVAKAADLPISSMNVNGIGESDEESFIRRKICTLTLHSLTSEKLHIIHSSADDAQAINFGDYYKTYSLLSAYLASLDSAEISKHVCTVKPVRY